MRAVSERVGIKPWGDMFQTLRRSCEIEWAQVHPQYAVSRWIGHSITVSGKHYVNNVPDELFDRVSGAQQKAQQSVAEMGGIKGNVQNANMPETPEKQGESDILTYGGGGIRTLVPRQVDDRFYVRRLHIVVMPLGVRSLTSTGTSPSCVLADDQGTLSPEHSAV